MCLEERKISKSRKNIYICREREREYVVCRSSIHMHFSLAVVCTDNDIVKENCKNFEHLLL